MSKDGKKNGNLIPIDGGGQSNEMKESLRNLKKNLPEFIEYHLVMAQVQRAKFLALIKEGFNEAQALEIVKEIR